MTETLPSKPAPRRRGCLAKSIALLIGLLLAALAGEALVRLFMDELLPHPTGPRYSFVSDDLIGLRLNPGFEGRWSLFGEFDVEVKINSHGCRDREFGPKQPGTIRILCLGDSYGFGYGVRGEDAYPKVLERLLSGGARKIEVLNAGASSYGLPHMIETLKRLREWFEPDVVLTSFFYVNDLDDIAKFPEHYVRGGIVLSRHFAEAVDQSGWLQFCFGWSDLALLVERTWFNRQNNVKLGHVPKPVGEPIGIAGLKILTGGAAAKRAELWASFESQLGALKRETAATGAQLVLFTIPVPCQVREDVWQQLRAEGRVDAGFDRDLVGKVAQAICARQGVMFCDLVPGFRASQPASPRFFPINRHFNEAGHALAAELLAAFLRSQGLFD